MSTTERKPPKKAILPLVEGQRLDRATFHERYEAMPPGIKAELIGGVVYMPSPVGREHGVISADTSFWLAHYRRRTPGVQLLADSTTMLDDLGEPQPDVQLRILPEYGGQSRDEGKFVGGAPELIVEVAKTTRYVDLGPKQVDYERAGVREYVVVAFRPDEVIWHVLRDGQLVIVPPDTDGLYRSEVFPGLWLDPLALLTDNLDALIATLDRGLAAPEHAAFVARLAEARARA
jgi:Uma2 family endonuclease